MGSGRTQRPCGNADMPDTSARHVIDDIVAHRAREGLTDKVNRLIDTFAENADSYTPDQAVTVDEVIARLIVDITPEGRISIAERIAGDPKAPRLVIEQLASDDWAEVASPVLMKSPQLSDETLLKIIDSKGHSHLLAISRRRSIAPEVAQSLVERGNRTVIRTLARNPGVNLSPEARRDLDMRQKARLEELRKAPRKAVEYPAELHREDGEKPVRCRLIDISKTGARLTLAAMARPTGRLVLSFASAAVQRPCEPVWQDGRDIGVRFV